MELKETNKYMRHLSALIFSLLAALQISAAPPMIGQKAADFALSTPAGDKVRLSEEISKGPVVLVILRGYPGYQCPYCNRQVQDYIQNAQALAEVGARILLVYPGPSENLGAKANEFLVNKQLPPNITLVLDPGYEVTNQYGLRWDMPNETAYPSTFLIDKNGVVFFAKMAKAHGGRSTAAEVLEMFPKRKAL
jgi:peroxiredoxin